MDKKIYLLGPLMHKDQNQLKNFVALRSEINKIAECEVVFPEFTSSGTSYWITTVGAVKDLDSSIKEMIDCDIVITMDNWFDDEMSNKEHEIASILGKQIIHFTALSKINS
jgi:hypothetical protein